MRRPVRRRLTVCLSTVAATALLGGAFAPAASAGPDRKTQLPSHLSTSYSNAPNVVSDVPPFGRKLA